MTSRPFLLSAATLALLASATGSKDSAKTAPAPTVTPSPAAQAQQGPTGPLAPSKPIPAPGSSAPSPITNAPPIKTLEVNSPASFAPGQLPEGGPVAFIVPAVAGQFLRLRVSAPQAGALPLDSRGVGFTLKVTPSGVGSPELRPGLENCDFSSWLYALPQTGSYQVVFDPAGKKLGISFTLLEGDDPLVGPGIKPDRVSVDFGSLANGGFYVVPYDPCDEGYSWPSHLAVTDDGFEMRIMPVTGYKTVFRDESMSNLQIALERRGVGSNPVKLPYPIYGDVGGVILATRPKFLQGDGWRGMSWIGAFFQDYGCGLAYFFEGISADGHFFILIRARLQNPEVGRHLDQKCEAAPKGRGFEEFFKKEMPAAFDKEMSAADPASFQPNLNELDAVIRSLKLKP